MYLHWLEEIDIIQRIIFDKPLNPDSDDMDVDVPFDSYNLKKQIENNADIIFNTFQTRLNDFDASSSNFKMLDLIYDLRVKLFSVLDLEFQSAYFMMLKSILHSKYSTKYFETLILFKECEKIKHIIPNYELENAKHMVRLSNGLSAIEYLNDEMKNIEKKWYKLTKDNLHLKNSGILDISLPSQIRRYILEIKAKSRFNQKDITHEFIDYIK